MTDAGKEAKHHLLIKSISSLELSIKKLIALQDEILGEKVKPDDARKQVQEFFPLAKVISEASEMIHALATKIDQATITIRNAIF